MRKLTVWLFMLLFAVILTLSGLSQDWRMFYATLFLASAALITFKYRGDI